MRSSALKELEFDHRTGTVSDEDYRAQVGPLRREVASALQALDRRFGGGSTTPASETRRMGRRSLALAGLALALVAAGPAAADDPADEKAAVDARIAALQAEIAESKAQDGVLTSQLSAVVAELEDAQAAVDDAAGRRLVARGGAVIGSRTAR